MNKRVLAAARDDRSFPSTLHGGRGVARGEDRIRGARLLKIKEEWLRTHPLCVRCMARTPPVYRPATELDHIVALTNGGLDFDVDGGENRQGLCDECHVEKTGEDMGYRPAVRIGLDGFPQE